MSDTIKIQRAILSVSDKAGLAEFAHQLAAQGVELFSTGGTRRHLEEAGLSVRDIADYTGFPEMMGGRLKTLHPRIFGGILCRHDRPDDMEAIGGHGIQPFELVVVNLYPFEQTIAKEGVTDAEAIEQIDIGGPSLVRAAAKNHAFTAIATSPSQYSAIAAELSQKGGTSLATRRTLAGAAFARTAEYDRAISGYFALQSAEPTADDVFPETLATTYRRIATLRYGENPHQPAAMYACVKSTGPSLVAAEQLNGKELSYNNYLDLDSAWSIARSLPRHAVVVIKHNNPCGAASADDLATATQNAMDGDPLSAFGSVLGFNQPVTAAAAEVLAKPGLFVEAIVAPSYTPEALEILTTRPKWRSNVRLLAIGAASPAQGPQLRQIDGGMLVQSFDNGTDPEAEWKVATDITPSDDVMDELRFAWEIVRHVKSNAIAVTKDLMLCGAGAGQMSRVDSVEIAIRKAGDRVSGAVLSSDAFFPFPDSIHRIAETGIRAIIQPGGSKRDDEVIAACNEHGIPMILTGRRHFKH
ncbi:MAG: bifunctional phosphoribosylaminoimidazolecarboxamide formyltransferase/IMP cyclohydrolase [Planctomycetales bacterium]|nr:bifunctional phosphoribosylaminoimidazolecarboxamide formyltransferase/IMP cyclohydrolase [Planctomycetales bacterium]